MYLQGSTAAEALTWLLALDPDLEDNNAPNTLADIFKHHASITSIPFLIPFVILVSGVELHHKLIAMLIIYYNRNSLFRTKREKENNRNRPKKAEIGWRKPENCLHFAARTN
jgi:hypothetical protein